ncbi:MAG: AI-2E family transporter [Thermoanaerobaculia bacterium]
MTTSAPRERSSAGAVVGLAAGFLVVAGLKLAAPILVPVVFAIFLAILAMPLLNWLIARRLPTFVAVLLLLVVLAGVATLFVLLFLGSVGELKDAGPHYYAQLNDRLSYTVDWWQAKGISILDWVPAKWRQQDTFVGLLGGTVKGLLHIASQATIVFLTLIFMLFETAVVPRKIARLPQALREPLSRFGEVSRELQRYLLIKALMAATIAVVIGLWLAFLGVDFPVLCALLAFACHFIPNVGAILAAGPAMLLAFVQFDLVQAIAVGVGYLVIGTLLGNLAEPALLGRRLGLSTLVVFLSLLFWGWLWGPVGMLLSVPLTVTTKILLERSATWGWVAMLLDSGEENEPGSDEKPAATPGDLAARPEKASGALDELSRSA